MKKIFLSSFFLCAFALFAFAQTKLEPTSSKFEARAISEALAESDMQRRASILKEFCADKDAGASLFFNAANAFAQIENFKDAEIFYKKALNILPAFYLAHRNLAFQYLNVGAFENAISEFEKALALSSIHQQEIWRALAKAHIEQKHFEEALTCLEHALVFSTNDENLLRAKALCLQKTKQWQALKNLCERLLKNNPKDPQYWRMMARLHMESNNVNSAIVELESMVHLNIAEVSDRILLGDLYASKAMYKKAALAYGDSKIDAKKAYAISRAFALLNMPSESRIIAKNLSVESAEFLEVEALVLKSEGKDYRATLLKSYEKNPASEYVCLELADSDFTLKNYESAKIFYRAALGKERLRSLVGIANSHIALGEFKEAQAIFENVAREFMRPEFAAIAEKLKEASNAKK